MQKLRVPFNGKSRITFKFGEDPDWYTSVFGYPHNGVDWGMKAGRAILACDDGHPIFCDKIPDADGMGVILKHLWGISLYWHLSRIKAKLWEPVKRGDLIGLSGATGFVTGPHLHFGLNVFAHKNEKMRDWNNPLEYLDKVIPEPSIPMIEPKYYRVKIGDTLWGIAEKFYQNGAMWPKIYRANKEKIKHPGLIFPFQKLLIP